jgi:acetyl-CoA carboxylase biotin carboxyl carrier protein
MALSDEDVREILRIIDSSELDEVRVETRGFRLHVRRGGAPADAEPAAGGAEPATANGEPAPPERRRAARGSPDGARTIEAPMLGTFYRAEGPNADPFVEVGSRVEPDTVVAIIEVMKMMNSIKAGVSGTIVEVCAENAELIEEGQPLFRVEAA